MSETTQRIKGSISKEDIKTAKWLINECACILAAMHDVERDLFNKILNWFGGIFDD